VHGGLLLPSRVDERNINHLPNGHVVRVGRVNMHVLRRWNVQWCDWSNVFGDLHKLRGWHVLRSNRRDVLGDLHKLRGWHVLRSNRCDFVRDLHKLRGWHVLGCGRVRVPGLFCGQLLDHWPVVVRNHLSSGLPRTHIRRGVCVM